MISTHILDLGSGAPAPKVNVKLERQDNSTWAEVDEQLTNVDGRIQYSCPATPGVYRLTFEIEPYLKSRNQAAFFQVAPVVFKIEDTSRKYHIPLLLSHYGYSTYRGS